MYRLFYHPKLGSGMGRNSKDCLIKRIAGAAVTCGNAVELGRYSNGSTYVLSVTELPVQSGTSVAGAQLSVAATCGHPIYGHIPIKGSAHMSRNGSGLRENAHVKSLYEARIVGWIMNTSHLFSYPATGAVSYVHTAQL